MDAEVVKSDSFEVTVEPGSKENSSLLPKEENGVVHQVNGIGGPIKFGSHGVDEPKESVLGTNFPRDVVDDWPAPQQIHSFYFVKYRPYEDPALKNQLEKAETELRNKSAVRSQIFDKLRAKKSDLAELIAQVKPLHKERNTMWEILGEKKQEMQPLRDALSGKSWNANGGPKEKGAALFSSVEELNAAIKGMEYRLQHETNSIKVEKQILRDISQLESTRGKVAANAALRMKIQDSMGGKDAIQDQVKLVGVDMDAVREDRRAINTKIKPLDDECKALDREIEALKAELDVATKAREAAVTARENIWKLREPANTSYYKNRTILNQAKELAAQKDVEAVKKLQNDQVDEFIKSWTSDKKSREDYEKRLPSSLDFRQLSKDGRIRNPGEKPLVPPTQAAPAFTSAAAAAAKANVKQAKENHVASSPQVDKPQKEDKAVLTKESKKKEAGSDLEEEEVISGLKNSQPKQKQVDEVKSKEMIREEELAKAKQALERKKKLAEKAAAKAAIKAQKEAEKKLKEKEKKAKKKAAASGSLPEPEEAEEEAEAAEEPEKVEEDIKPPVASKSKSRKENTARLRTKPRGPEALPKAILKRKRSANYWAWGVPAAAVAAGLAVLAIGYTYFI